MPEGLTTSEVGNEIGGHAAHAGAPGGHRHDRVLSIPQASAAAAYEHAADASFQAGEKAGATGDKYVRDTVFLATVLFLVGISGHFPLRQARYGLVAIGALLLVFSVVQLLQLPGPPA